MQGLGRKWPIKCSNWYQDTQCPVSVLQTDKYSTYYCKHSIENNNKQQKATFTYTIFSQQKETQMENGTNECLYILLEAIRTHKDQKEAVYAKN